MKRLIFIGLLMLAFKAHSQNITQAKYTKDSTATAARFTKLESAVKVLTDTLNKYKAIVNSLPTMDTATYTALKAYRATIATKADTTTVNNLKADATVRLASLEQSRTVTNNNVTTNSTDIEAIKVYVTKVKAANQ